MTHSLLISCNLKQKNEIWIVLILQDPSVQQAVEGTGTKQANLEDYNPFDAQKNQTTSANNAGKWRNRKMTLKLVYYQR